MIVDPPDPVNLVREDVLWVSVPSLGLVGTLLLYFRSMDAWLRKQVDEELRSKQLGIDVDRANWVVEVLSEGAVIPDEILAALTRNLFVGPNKTDAVTHPTEDALAALLGSARSIDLQFPGGGISTTGKHAKKAVEKTSGSDE